MTKIIGPYLESLILILKTHKSIISLGDKAVFCEDCQGQITDAFNEDFRQEDDLIDPFISRLLDILGIPQQIVLRHLCGEQMLKYLMAENDEIKTIQTLLYLKKLYQEHSEQFQLVETFLAHNPEFEFIE